MNPLQFLKEEWENVSAALKETLRHDYGPAEGQPYYGECLHRLGAAKRRIDGLELGDPGIPAVLATLGGIANRVSLIERSHLGEFSWPFANAIRAIAAKLLVERDLRGDLVPPIIHMIAEGTGYHIRNERTTDRDLRRRIAIVAFPRQLKHHVLMHAIFGHELGHAAFYTNVAGRICNRRVVPELRGRGPLTNPGTLEDWLSSSKAPAGLRERLARSGEVRIQTAQVAQWSVELTCDLFGLLLFGPAFVAAHRALLEPASRPADEIELNSTHPPLSVRRRMLVQAMSVLGWDVPTVAEEGPVRQAERAMLEYVMADDGGEWPELFDRDQLSAAIRALRSIFDAHPELLAMPPTGEVTTELVSRLAKRLPPILETIDREGVAEQRAMAVSDCLFAGWIYWLGREHLAEPGSRLTFFQTNRLCDYALLQQQAIDLARGFER